MRGQVLTISVNNALKRNAFGIHAQQIQSEKCWISWNAQRQGLSEPEIMKTQDRKAKELRDQGFYQSKEKAVQLLQSIVNCLFKR